MHALRDHFASMLLAAGMSIRDVAEYLGRSDPAFTLRVYTHLLRPATDVPAMSSTTYSTAPALLTAWRRPELLADHSSRSSKHDHRLNPAYRPTRPSPFMAKAFVDALTWADRRLGFGPGNSKRSLFRWSRDRQA